MIVTKDGIISSIAKSAMNNDLVGTVIGYSQQHGYPTTSFARGIQH